ncbi:hypothetical protein ON058_08405 [Demequina sp. B12]|uniref:hypothetical protein n=1 Tax=Demequina sp. B12 TaxID=2992757 RepID=UPI00237AFB71|nr:hypothetical protein [Demequina sp. B12]MDE0573436.1 hypothetical protein [Demequina sp. B12]
MFENVGSTLTVLIVLALVVFAVAGLSEGRLQHLIGLISGAERRRLGDHVYDEIERRDNDWDLLGGVDSIPDDVSGAERAKDWALNAYGQAKEQTLHAVDVGRQKIADHTAPEAATTDSPTTGELAVGRR